MDMLARREFARQELIRKLAPRVEALELMESVVAKLIEEGLLCDDRYTEAYTRSRWRKGFGPVRIALELREKGVSEELILKHINNNDDRWFALIAHVAKKKYGYAPLDDPADKAKRVRFYQYRGFNFDHINSIIEP
ncbi:MAG: hypothetical protein COB51_07590 [Moraxellaceae bacterium]|nr:MAG: hypothetical protein COB51_07590 [Moraxellaceae bacterium]